MTHHICKVKDYCICSQWADEPNDNCEIHGQGVYPPRCKDCGRFLRREIKKNE
jgi:hypothetical protein